MTATEELRRMLDERGVEWMDDSYAQLWCTVWHGQDGKQWRMTENRSGMLTELKAWHVTPEQAIDATLGRGECCLVRHGSLADWPEMVCWSCSVCNFGWHHSVNDKQFNYCPSCGRKVVDA